MMNLALNNATNVAQYYKDLGEKVSIEIVTYGPGLHMLRDDTSPVKARIETIALSTPEISFKACGNTRENMRKAENKDIPIIPQAQAREVRRCARHGTAGEGLVVCKALTHSRQDWPAPAGSIKPPPAAARSSAAWHPASWSTPVPSGSRCRMSFSRPSSSSVVKPCTSDHARAIAAAWSSDSASSALAGELFVAAGADRVRQAFEGGGRRLVQRRPRHVEPLGAEHQPVHAGPRLRIGDIGLGARQRLHQRVGFGSCPPRP